MGVEGSLILELQKLLSAPPPRDGGVVLFLAAELPEHPLSGPALAKLAVCVGGQQLAPVGSPCDLSGAAVMK